jgi:multidrug resistance efflux pump
MRLLLIICLVVAAGTYFPLPDLPSLSGRQTPDSPPTAEASKPTEERRYIFAAGVIEGADREVVMDFEIGGRIVETPVYEGQTVNPGDLLARLDDSLFRQQLAQSEANLRLAEAERDRLVNGAKAESRAVARAEAKLMEVQVKQAEADLRRAARLFEQGAIPDQHHDDARFRHETAVAKLQEATARVAEIEAPARDDELQMANAKVMLAQAKVQEAREMLERTRLTAPAGGVVLRVDVQPGEVVSPEFPRSAVTMANLGCRKVRAYVEELDALALAAGQRVHVTADGRPDVKYHGTLQWIAPSMGNKQHRHHDPAERMDVKVREALIELEHAPDLVVGLPVEVFIEPLQTTTPAEATTAEAAEQLADASSEWRATQSAGARPLPTAVGN